jgi:FkbM family methyltransferase
VPQQTPPFAEPESRWGTMAPDSLARIVIWLSRNTPLGRGGARKALAWLFGALHSGPVDVELWGSEVRLHPANNVVERKALLRPDVFDHEERGVLRNAMIAPGRVFVDIGGNAGLYSLDAALHAGEGAKILTIEPDAALMGRFAFNFVQARDLGRIASSVTSIRQSVAVSDRDGSGILSVAGDEGSRNILGEGAAGGMNVNLKTLDSIVRVAGITHIDVMKIDVEGYEDKVLPPFLATVPERQWPSIIIIEHLQRAGWKPDCIADAERRGYEIFKTTRNNTFLRRPIKAAR